MLAGIGNIKPATFGKCSKIHRFPELVIFFKVQIEQKLEQRGEAYLQPWNIMLTSLPAAPFDRCFTGRRGKKRFSPAPHNERAQNATLTTHFSAPRNTRKMRTHANILYLMPLSSLHHKMPKIWNLFPNFEASYLHCQRRSGKTEHIPKLPDRTATTPKRTFFKVPTYDWTPP